MKIKMKRLFGIILSLVLVLGLMPWTSLTAYAVETTIRCEGTNGHIETMFPKNGIIREGGANVSQLYPGGVFKAPEGKCFTKIEVIESEYNDYHDSNSWTGWQGRAIEVNQTKEIIVSNNNKIIIDFTVDDLAVYNVTLNTNG